MQMEREVSEGIALTFSKADIIMYQKSEHHQSAVYNFDDERIKSRIIVN